MPLMVYGNEESLVNATQLYLDDNIWDLLIFLSRKPLELTTGVCNKYTNSIISGTLFYIVYQITFFLVISLLSLYHVNHNISKF